MSHRFSLPVDEDAERVVVSVSGCDIVLAGALEGEDALGADEDQPLTIADAGTFETDDPAVAEAVATAYPDLAHVVDVDGVEYDVEEDAAALTEAIAAAAAAEAAALAEAQHDSVEDRQADVVATRTGDDSLDGNAYGDTSAAEDGETE